MELAEAVKAENNLLRDANSCAARSRSIDDPNYSEICKPSMGMEKQPLNSLEPYFTNEVEMEPTHGFTTPSASWSDSHTLTAKGDVQYNGKRVMSLDHTIQGKFFFS